MLDKEKKVTEKRAGEEFIYRKNYTSELARGQSNGGGEEQERILRPALEKQEAWQPR